MNHGNLRACILVDLRSRKSLIERERERSISTFLLSLFLPTDLDLE